ncbi:MAG: hypothetical protein Kow0068_13930 [Marinilabiliales bacterium]
MTNMTHVMHNVEDEFSDILMEYDLVFNEIFDKWENVKTIIDMY